MKFLLIFSLMITGMVQSSSGQLQIGAGTNWRSEGGTYVVLQNIGFQYNTSTSLLENRFVFAGDADAGISGSGLPIFSSLDIAKSGTANLILQRSINLTTVLNFQSGKLNLNGFNLNLGTNATISGETESAGITSTTTGVVIISANLNAPNLANPGNLGAQITSNQNLGSVLIRRGHLAQVIGNGQSVLRYYDIEPSNNSGLNATLRFPYFENELNGNDENTLLLWRSQNLVNWSEAGADSRNTGSNYVEKTGIDAFSRWTLAPPASTLPLRWGYVTVRCEGNGPVIKWQTLQEINTQSFIIQRSEDGLQWLALQTIPASGNSNLPRDYQFSDNTSTGGPLFYRIKQVDLDGRFSYSSTLRSGCPNSSLIKIFPTITSGALNISVPIDPGIQKLELALYDATGKLMMNRSMTYQSQQISMEHLPAGLYIAEIRLGNNLTRTRIIKQ